MSNWWDFNTDEKQMLEWIGDYNAASKIVARKHIINKGYKTILDVGAGLCSEYYGYKNDGYDIDYKAVDGCEKFVNKAKEAGINAELSNVDKLSDTDNSKDVVYIRHIVEHLPHYDTTIKEALRVAKQEVLLIFFITPTNAPHMINWNGELFHNHYNRKQFVEFLKTLPEFDRFETEEVDEETIYHIYKKNG